MAENQTTTCRLYGIKNCDSVKKAIAWLEANGQAYEFIDYKKAGLVAQELPGWVTRSSWQALLNTRGLTWRKLGADERADLDEHKALQLMVHYPTLIKRPVLDTGRHLLLGFDAARYAERLR